MMRSGQGQNPTAGSPPAAAGPASPAARTASTTRNSRTTRTTRTSGTAPHAPNTPNTRESGATSSPPHTPSADGTTSGTGPTGASGASGASGTTDTPRAAGTPQAAGAPNAGSADFRQVMSGHAAGVAVVTADGGGRPAGLTVTSLTSFSELPPTVCFNVGVTARSHGPVTRADALGVHLLTTGQRQVAEVFASRADDKFSGLDWSWDGSVPRLPEALAYLLCLPVAVFRHGDHSLVVAEVVRMESEGGAPLIYLHRSLGWQLVTNP